jgi:hypothetical protein
MKKTVLTQRISRPTDRRLFLKGGLLAGGAALGASLLANPPLARAQARTQFCRCQKAENRNIAGTKRTRSRSHLPQTESRC